MMEGQRLTHLQLVSVKGKSNVNNLSFNCEMMHIQLYYVYIRICYVYVCVKKLLDEHAFFLAGDPAVPSCGWSEENKPLLSLSSNTSLDAEDLWRLGLGAVVGEAFDPIIT